MAMMCNFVLTMVCCSSFVLLLCLTAVDPYPMPHSEEDCDTSGGQQGPAPLPDPSKVMKNSSSNSSDVSTSSMKVEQSIPSNPVLPSTIPQPNETVSDQPSVCENEGIWCNSSNSCIPADKRCDGKNDCIDGSDEQCADRLCCPSTNFHFCVHNETRSCIPASWFCDGVIDCDSGEDEREAVFQHMHDECFHGQKHAIQIQEKECKLM